MGRFVEKDGHEDSRDAGQLVLAACKLRNAPYECDLRCRRVSRDRNMNSYARLSVEGKRKNVLTFFTPIHILNMTSGI